MKIRSVHPEFFTDPKLTQLDYDARLLYIGLWCCADDDGRGRYLLKTIEGQVFPRDQVDINRLMWQLERQSFIRLYEVDGEMYYEIPTWSRWQKPRYKAVSKIPAPENGKYVSTEDFSLSASFSPESGRLLQEEARGEGEGEGEGEGATTAEFSSFNAKRAVAKVRERKKKGLPVKSEAGLAKTIQKSREHIEESRALFAHRDCEKCGGTGEVDDYAPGTGGFKRQCPDLLKETVA